MITIIHGTDTASSRKFFLDLKNTNPDGTFIDGQSVTITDLAQHFGGGGLFGESKVFFIEQFISKKKKSPEISAMTDAINTASVNNDIYIWEDKEITPANIKQFKNPVIKVFKLSSSLFMFLESIRPSNTKSSIKLFHETTETTDPEMVFFMLVRQIRTLLALKESTQDEIDELRRMSPWQISKISQQAKYFDVVQLKAVHNKLFEIETGLKTGSLSMTLVQAIDLLLLDI